MQVCQLCTHSCESRTDSRCMRQVDLKEVVGTGKFDMAKAQRAAGWLQSLISDGPVVPETEEYGISSFIYR